MADNKEKTNKAEETKGMEDDIKEEKTNGQASKPGDGTEKENHTGKPEDKTAGDIDKTEADSKSSDVKNSDDPEAEKTEDNSPKSDEAEEKTAKPDKKDQKIAELNDKYVRLFAEFDNFRKRSEAEKSGMFTEGERTVLLKVLPLIDNFERALGTIPEEEKDSPMAQGLEKVYKAFTDQLKELGVTQIEAVGHEFDANLHNAVMHIDDEEQPENIITEEFQKGYMFGDKVLRYSMVKVAN